MTTRKEQKEERRQSILEAALDLFVTKGYAGTKIEDIAQRLNMSKGLLFHYFNSKEAVYEELVRQGLEGTRRISGNPGGSALDFLTKRTSELLMALKHKASVAKVFVLMATAQRSASTPEHIRTLAHKVNTIEEFVPIVKQGQREGTIRDGNPQILSRTFWCALQGIAEEYAFHPDNELPQPEWIIGILRRNDEQ